VELSKKAIKTLNRWTADGYYVYMRVTTSKWYWPDEEHTLFWNVNVEFRNTRWIIWDGKGESLDLLIRELGEQIPRRSKIHTGFIPADEEGSEIGKLAKALSALPKKKRNKVHIEVRRYDDKSSKKKGKK
jgi:hypothetical protein